MSIPMKPKKLIFDIISRGKQNGKVVFVSQM